MTRKILGLELSTHAVTAVKVTCGPREIRIDVHARVEVVPSEAGGGGLINALAMLADAVDPTGCICAASIPAGLAAFRNLSVPFRNPKKIRQILPFELEPALPYVLDEVSIGFRPLALPSVGRNGETELLTAAVKKDLLQTYLDALATAGIRPDTITVGGYAAARWMASRRPDSDAFLVDVDGDHCTVFALAGGEVAQVRAFSIASANTPVLDSLGSRVLQTCRAMEDMLPGPFAAQAVFLVGDDGADRTPALSKALGTPVTRTDFIRETSGAVGWEADRMDNALALALAEAQGLAGVNFQPQPSGLKKLWIENRVALNRTALLAGIMLVLALIGVWADVYAKQKRLDTLNRQMTAVFTETFPEVRTVVDPLQQMRVKLQEARQEAGGTLGFGTRMRAVDILRQISDNIPGEIDVALGQVTIGPDEVRIAGSTDGFDSVEHIKGSLSGISEFKFVSITSATVEKSGRRVRFRLKIDL